MYAIRSYYDFDTIQWLVFNTIDLFGGLGDLPLLGLGGGGGLQHGVLLGLGQGLPVVQVDDLV